MSNMTRRELLAGAAGLAAASALGVPAFAQDMPTITPEEGASLRLLRWVPFVKGDDGSWSLTIGPMKPDMYAFSERRRRRWPIDYRSASRRSRAGAIAAVQIS